MGLFSIDKDNPLEYLANVGWSGYKFDIISRSSFSMVLRQGVESHNANPNYLGAIVSKDGSEVFWINNLIL